MSRPAIALVAIALSIGFAGEVAADEAAADREFRAAQAAAARGDRAAVDRLEALGATRPLTRWSDDAWAEAARLAERAGDYARARRALDEVIAIGADDRLVRRARAARERLATITGQGRWDAVARDHERLVAAAFGGGDPRDELAELERLVHAHPAYPRANAIRVAIARGWEQEGDPARAGRWFAAAAAADTAPGRHASLAWIRALVRAGELDAAADAVARLGAADVDVAGVARVRELLDQARSRRWQRRGAAAVLASLLVVALLAVRRGAGSLAAAARRLVRPPVEVVFLLPVAALLVGAAYLGNPLVARAVRDITLGGVVIAWISGTILEVSRARPRRGRRLAIHAACVALAVAATAYLAIDRDRLLDLVGETWRAGPNLR